MVRTVHRRPFKCGSLKIVTVNVVLFERFFFLSQQGSCMSKVNVKCRLCLFDIPECSDQAIALSWNICTESRIFVTYGNPSVSWWDKKKNSDNTWRPRHFSVKCRLNLLSYFYLYRASQWYRNFQAKKGKFRKKRIEILRKDRGNLDERQRKFRGKTVGISGKGRNFYSYSHFFLLALYACPWWASLVTLGTGRQHFY